MVNKFWESLKKVNKLQAKYNNKNSNDYINKTPTEEELKDNSNGKKAVILSTIALFLCIVISIFIVLLFDFIGAIGLFSIFLLLIPANVQRKSIKHVKKQLNINGKGFGKLCYCKYIVGVLMVAVILIALIFIIKLLVKV